MINKKLIKSILKISSADIKYEYHLSSVYNKYSGYTMIPENIYKTNLKISDKYLKDIKGDVVECGVWKGGMTAGIAEMLGNERNYYLFDSFEGLPLVQEIDGSAAKKWQNNKTSTNFFDNCRAEIVHADTVMQMTNCNYRLIKGWFNETLPKFDLAKEIALLRLDADWYESTIICLRELYPKVVNRGIVIIDDYFQWNGCSKAVHDYLSEIKSKSCIRTINDVCFIIKTEDEK